MLLSGIVFGFWAAIKPKKYIVSLQGLLNSLVIGMHQKGELAKALWAQKQVQIFGVSSWGTTPPHRLGHQSCGALRVESIPTVGPQVSKYNRFGLLGAPESGTAKKVKAMLF